MQSTNNVALDRFISCELVVEDHDTHNYRIFILFIHHSGPHHHHQLSYSIIHFMALKMALVKASINKGIFSCWKGKALRTLSS
jgi:hypothetical protein